MFELSLFVSAFLLGFLSSTHCVGMCGGIMGALTMSIDTKDKKQRFVIIALYNIGRVTSYTLMGSLVGLLGHFLATHGADTFLRILAAVFLLMMALYVGNWWRGLTYIEAVGGKLWQYISPLAQKLLPVRKKYHAFLLGLLWGWLPCGLVYSALSFAMTQANASLSAMAMFAFGCGTLPAVVALGFMVEPFVKLAKSLKFRQTSAILLILFAIWTLYGALATHPAGHGQHADSPTNSSHSHH